ncbi:MAG: TIGR03618 family F420-dependent PPOX class oxidoreductase [Gammaproteobacteria bacterium]|nr:TIGR03618 family F420-dependent PPOX class oxidoreductase [Gammaproteobacteria bacterium]
MAKELNDDVKRLLDGPNFAHLATLMADGSPKVEPTWISRDGNLVLIATDSRGIKGQNIARDSRVALSVTSFDDPYEQVLIRGVVIETRDDNGLEVLDSLSRQYIGCEFPRRKWSSRVVYVIEPSVARYYQSPLEHSPGA